MTKVNIGLDAEPITALFRLVHVLLRDCEKDILLIISVCHSIFMLSKSFINVFIPHLRVLRLIIQVLTGIGLKDLLRMRIFAFLAASFDRWIRG